MFDLDESDPKRKDLDRRILDLAGTMAGMEDGTLDMFHAWYLPFEQKLRSDDLMRGINTVDALLKKTRNHKKLQLEAFASEWTGLEPRIHLVKGEPQTAIPKFTKTNRTDLVVMGTVGRTGIAGLFIGNTAEKILRNLNCSVLAIKPTGFKSPVR